jgi:hypothetical protein
MRSTSEKPARRKFTNGPTTTVTNRRRGSCTAEANTSCQIQCQSTSYEQCKTTAIETCAQQCEQPEGSLVCDGNYVGVGGDHTMRSPLSVISVSWVPRSSVASHPPTMRARHSSA